MNEIYDILENEIMEYDSVKIYFQDKKLYIVEENGDIIDIIEDDKEFMEKVKRVMIELKKDTLQIDKKSVIYYYQYIADLFEKPKKYQIDYDYYFPEIEIINNKMITRNDIEAVLMSYEGNYILLKMFDNFKFYRKEEKNDVWTVYWYYCYNDNYIIIFQKEDHYLISYNLFFIKK